MKFLCYSVMLPVTRTFMFSSNLLNNLSLAHYYEIYLLSIFEVLPSCNSLMLSKLKFEAQSQVASFSKFDSNETCSSNLQRIKTKLNNQIKIAAFNCCSGPLDGRH